MKGLSLMQPWASLVALGLKEYETRNWQRQCRDELLIHASLNVTREGIELTTALRDEGILPTVLLPTGCVLAVVESITFHRTEDIRDQLSARERRFGNYDDGRYAGRLAHVRPLRQPIPWKGALGFWSVPQMLLDLIAGQGVL